MREADCLPDDITSVVFGGKGNDNITRFLDEVNEEDRSRLLEWAAHKLVEADTNYSNARKESIAKSYRNLYKEDRRQVARWILNDTSPPLEAEPEEVQQFFEERWNRQMEYIEAPQDSPWHLDMILDEEDMALLQPILDEDEIE